MTGVVTSLRRWFAKIRVHECNRDIASIGEHGSPTLKFLDAARRVVGQYCLRRGVPLLDMFVYGLSGIFLVGLIGCVFVIPITAIQLFSILFEHDSAAEEERSKAL